MKVGKSPCPLLFLLYVNDSPNISNSIYPFLFADDTTIIFRGDNMGDVTTVCNSELGNIFNWATRNRLSLTHLFPPFQHLLSERLRLSA